MIDTTAATLAPTPAMTIDAEALLSYLRTHVPEFSGAAQGLLLVSQFSHGQSNPTYLIQAPQGARYVLRKKPPGELLPSAHAVEREYAVLRALRDTPVPVPRVLCLCEDASVLGTPFYLMQHVAGVVFDDPALPGVDPGQRSAIYQGMASTLAALHSVSPAAVGLGGYGAPTGYNTSQVRRWKAQYLKSGQGPSMPEMLRLIVWLEGRAADTDARASTCITHGDYRLDNLVFAPGSGSASGPAPRVLAVLDWELSTLGDPLADLAYSAVPFHLTAAAMPGLVLPDVLPEGIPEEARYVDAYCMARGIARPSQADWSFYLALSLFRIASIAAGVAARAAQGNASSRTATQIGNPVVIRGMALAALHIAGVGAPAAQASPGGGGQGSSSAAAAGPRGLGPSPRAAELVRQLQAFMVEHVYPAEAELAAHAVSDLRWTVHPRQEELKRLAQAQGLWNLWIPADMAAGLRGLVEAEAPGEAALLLGPGLSNLDYAHCAEVTGRSAFAPEAFNCSAPDTGNMEVLARYGSTAQQRTWLLPLLRGTLRSCFAMTEPAVASSDATNIQGSIRRCTAFTGSNLPGRRSGGSSGLSGGSSGLPGGSSGGSGASASVGGYVVSGRKWWISGATDPRCAVAIFMGRTDDKAPPHRQQSMVLVPMDDPGVKVVRALPVFGFDDAPHGHAEMVFDDVEVPEANLILGEGRGFEIAQGRLGPGRLHHCMRLVGAGERAVDLMVQRATSREAFGRKLAGHQSVRLDIANSRIELDAARLVVLQAAHMLDLHGNKAARAPLAQAKALTPATVCRIIDRAIQIHGGAGMTDVTPLSQLYIGARTLRLADGPDVVHLETVAKAELGATPRPRL